MDEEKARVVPKVLILIISLVVVLCGIGGSYALINYRANLTGSKENVITTCSLKMDVSSDNVINLSNAYPMDDVDISSLVPYSLTISKNENTCGAIGYNLSFVPGDEVLYEIDPNLIKYQITNMNTLEVVTDVNPYNMNINGMVEDKDASYEIKLWIDSSAVNDDLYVLDDNDEYLENEDGSYVTRSFSAKVKLNVSMK